MLNYVRLYIKACATGPRATKKKNNGQHVTSHRFVFILLLGLAPDGGGNKLVQYGMPESIVLLFKCYSMRFNSLKLVSGSDVVIVVSFLLLVK